MRILGISLAIFLAATAAFAQQEGPAASVSDASTFTSAAEVAALIARAKNVRKEGEPLVSQHLLVLPPYSANLEYRASVGPASVHEREAEFFYVLDGSGMMITGGKLVNEKRRDAANFTGTAIEGGVSRSVAKGDFIVVPENTPHWFSAIDQTLVLMSLHVPRPVPAAH